MHPRFFLLPEGTRPGPDGTVALAGEEAVHLRRVLRLREGDRVHLADGTGWRAPARVRRIGAGRGNGPRVVLELAGPAEEVDDLVPVHLLVAVLKKEAMDWLVQKAAELGAARLQPVVTARTVVRLDSSRAGARLERWRGLARQALKQCRGGRVTEVAPVAPLEAALAACAGLPGRFFLWEGGG
ncbi:16S rRNA (uracil(1498)-N(3))-methyltransferase, partial [Dissulfurirhabdus thermomarina]